MDVLVTMMAYSCNKVNSISTDEGTSPKRLGRILPWKPEWIFIKLRTALWPNDPSHVDKGLGLGKGPPPTSDLSIGLSLLFCVLHRLYKVELVTAKSLVTSRVDRPFIAFFKLCVFKTWLNL